MQGRKIRNLLAKPGADCHDRRAHVLVHAFKDAGMEIILVRPSIEAFRAVPL